jgi:hypothetical protein
LYAAFVLINCGCLSGKLFPSTRNINETRSRIFQLFDRAQASNSVVLGPGIVTPSLRSSRLHGYHIYCPNNRRLTKRKNPS